MRLLEQWKSLNEFFLVFFFTKTEILKDKSKTLRYKTIEEGLRNEYAEAYLAFLAYVSQNFETFLLKFQYDEPLIH